MPTINVYTANKPSETLAELNQFFSRFGCGGKDSRGALAEALRDMLSGELVILGYVNDEQAYSFTEWLRERVAEIEPRSFRDIAIAEIALQIVDALTRKE